MRKNYSMQQKSLLIIAALFLSLSVFAQPSKYTVCNAHSHNDYEQAVPFKTAYSAGFGSIEADIFLINGDLFVAHDTIELKKRIRLEDEYLKPLLTEVEKNKGFAFADSSKKLQMLIDIKTQSTATVNALVVLLKKYPALIKNISWVITGNRPEENMFITYPSFIFFDGELYKNYSAEALKKIVMMSDNFKKYSAWNGDGSINMNEENVLKNSINKSHALHKPVRFWNAPDNINAWKEFTNLQVDLINTDHINALADFFNTDVSK